MEINSYFITTAKPKANITASGSSAELCLSAAGRPIYLKTPKETRAFIANFAKLLKKPVVKR